jgi:fructokinase
MFPSKAVPTGHPLIFGEVLHDIFINENKKLLGGAPFNVAWHLRGFGLQPLLISRIAQDAEGQNIMQTLQNWGMDTRFLQQNSDYPTGQVQVSLQNGSPQFTIPAQQAYDQIEADPLLSQLQQTDIKVFYHGTLALRDTCSRATWQAIVEKLAVPIFLDLNLRAPWWQPDLMTRVVKAATWLKINEDEMSILNPHFKNASETTRETLLDDFCQQYQLKAVIVTLGEKGAILKIPQQPLLKQLPPSISVIDSVGAGDAFSAVCLMGLLQNWPFSLLLERALHFAAAICQMRGAICTDILFYRQITNTWT